MGASLIDKNARNFVFPILVPGSVASRHDYHLSEIRTIRNLTVHGGNQKLQKIGSKAYKNIA
jgi:hypothetical protein